MLSFPATTIMPLKTPLGSPSALPWIVMLAKSPGDVVLGPFLSMLSPLTVSTKMMPLGSLLPELKVRVCTAVPLQYVPLALAIAFRPSRSPDLSTNGLNAESATSCLTSVTPGPPDVVGVPLPWAPETSAGPLTAVAPVLHVPSRAPQVRSPRASTFTWPSTFMAPRVRSAAGGGAPLHRDWDQGACVLRTAA